MRSQRPQQPLGRPRNRSDSPAEKPMKIAYLDCPTGIAGDMCLGALVAAGVPLAYLSERLRALAIAGEFELEAEAVRRGSQRATKVHVRLRDRADRPHRHLPDIEQIVTRAALPPRAATWSLDIFRRLALAEGAVHGIAPERVHFHEVGAVDAIVDIVGTCLGLDWLQIDELHCSPLPTGGGTVKAAHGRLPVPVPAVLELWQMRQVPVYSNGIERELVTPTGAAIAVTLAQRFGGLPAMRVVAVGGGAGTADLALPNVLRLWVGERANDDLALEPIAILETQIDDLSPQVLAYTYDLLLAAGALDVFVQPVVMKKSRSGSLLTVICPPERVPACETILYRETTTLGIRRREQLRSLLSRETVTVATPLGPVRLKLAYRGTALANAQPEYEDCARLARDSGRALREVQQLALDCWRDGPPASR